MQYLHVQPLAQKLGVGRWANAIISTSQRSQFVRKLLHALAQRVRGGHFDHLVPRTKPSGFQNLRQKPRHRGLARAGVAQKSEVILTGRTVGSGGWFESIFLGLNIQIHRKLLDSGQASEIHQLIHGFTLWRGQLGGGGEGIPFVPKGLRHGLDLFFLSGFNFFERFLFLLHGQPATFLHSAAQGLRVLLHEVVEQSAAQRCIVLGEADDGKEVQWMHFNQSRSAQGPFVAFERLEAVRAAAYQGRAQIGQTEKQIAVALLVAEIIALRGHIVSVHAHQFNIIRLNVVGWSQIELHIVHWCGVRIRAVLPGLVQPPIQRICTCPALQRSSSGVSLTLLSTEQANNLGYLVVPQCARNVLGRGFVRVLRVCVRAPFQ
mmetsp:Transcript_30552/g.52350  ORF Transcript_30552/g.52350 Transcript_30552/m.52350 type:complete len:376 (-) Transcript_30552:868-1995(-)